jgi:dUTP pyrophosphatase
MRANIKRIDRSLPLPEYETPGAVAFDLICREQMTISPGQVGRIPANVVIEVPEGYMLLVSLRSSTPMRYGLAIPHGIGIIDNDYCGEDDEIKIQVLNFTDKPVVVPRGARIAQGTFVKIYTHEWNETDSMKRESRGGFGSTGQ